MSSPPPPHETPGQQKAEGAGPEIPTQSPGTSLAARAWPYLFAASVMMAVCCGVWVALAGIAGAAASTGFQYLVVATLILGIVVGGRFTMRPLREGGTLDRRNITDGSRGGGLW